MDEPRVRAEDYLNDKIQTPADLENIDSLLQGVKDQQVLLRKQLQEAETTLENAQGASQDQKTHLLQRAEAFRQKQADIDRRLLKITHSETSDQAVQLLDASMKKLQNLDIAVGYVELLQEVENLSTQARQQIKTSPEAALKPYIRLQHISKALKQLQPAAEGAAPHLVDHVDNASGTLWKQMKDTLSVQFEQTLARMKWPSKEAKFENGLLAEWEAGVEKLLLLQDPELMEAVENVTRQRGLTEAPVLLPLEVMVKPLELRFRYHFESDRPTNRLDKPEYFLSHIIDLLNTYAPMIATHLQPALRRHFQGTKINASSIYTNSTTVFITALLPMLRRKIFSYLPQIAMQPQLLSHFIHELIELDAVLRDEWAYDPHDGAGNWKGLTWEVLVGKDWFGRWLEVEKNFALSRYQSIVDAKDAGEIDYDSVEPAATKPTKAAIRVNDLLETITERYRPLISFSQKLRFLIDIQIAIFDKFHSRLHSGLEAYLAATSTVVRAVQGTAREDKASVEGIKGLERLCRIYGSADYLEKALETWSDDVFFLELWDELQQRARQRSSGNVVAGPLTVRDVAERTSSAVGSGGETGALFDETASAYRKLRIRTEEIIIDFLNKTMRDALRPYSKINPWSLLPTDDSTNTNTTTTTTTTTTAELDPLLTSLDASLSFLSRTISRPPLRHITRQMCQTIQAYLWEYVLGRHTFTLHSAQQFLHDVRAIAHVIDAYLGGPVPPGGLGQAEVGLKKLFEALRLLTLPIAAAAEGVGEDEKGEGEKGTGAGWDLHAVEEEIFASNERARDVLERLDVLVVTETEARNILPRRVDLVA
ncbi:MAG: hypothetical protein M1816_008201 [Peltula sp. TS41687]|nr:MAG: hypothetical protein M1816_008201 [Peltula sp. TS41687]